jgi:hypothetical protein
MIASGLNFVPLIRRLIPSPFPFFALIICRHPLSYVQCALKHTLTPTGLKISSDEGILIFWPSLVTALTEVVSVHIYG